MNIKVLIDFKILGDYKKDREQFNENLKILKKIMTIYKTDLFISKNDVEYFKSLEIDHENIEVFIEEELDNKESFITEISKKYDWILYFKNNTTSVKRAGNIIYSPINLKGDLGKFKNTSFIEHAKNKKYYHDFSDYYMYTLSNDTEKEGEFLIKIFKKYLNKDAGKVLDCCCGVGRHAYIMAKNGFKVTGFDFSKEQIENAKRNHNHPNIDYKIMDVKDFNIEDKDFDMSYCMWTTYNYLSLDEDFKNFIKANYLHQKKGAILVLDSKNNSKLETHRLYNRKTEKNDFKMELLINKYVFKNIQNSQYFIFINDKGDKKFLFDEEFVRFFSIEELKKIISGYYELVDIYGDFDMNKYDEKTSNRLITVLRRI